MTVMARFRQRSTLFWAVWLSVLVHAVLLTLHFEPELKKLKDQLPSLEVMLVNSHTKQAPEKADVLAQVNLDRGGNTDEKRTMQSPAPSQKPLPSAPRLQVQATAQLANALTPQDSELQLEKQRVDRLEQEAQALLTQLKSQHLVEHLQTLPRKQQATTALKNRANPEVQPLPERSQSSSLQEIAKLEALIARRQQDYESRPRRQYIGARTREYRFANYVEQWRQNIERVGNLNYPQAAKTQHLHGQLQLTVAIRADGSIESITINRSSGIKVLDEAARHIVMMAAPFAVFPDNIQQDTDILSITRTWNFTQQDAVTTE